MDWINLLFAIATVIVILMIVLASSGRRTRGGGIALDGEMQRRYKHVKARIISDTQIQLENVDDVDAWNLDRYHVSMLKERTNYGNGKWVYTFDKPMGVLGTQSEQDMYMEDALAEIQNLIDTVVNPEKDRAE